METVSNDKLVKSILNLKNERFVIGESNELLDIDFLSMPDWSEFKNFWNTKT